MKELSNLNSIPYILVLPPSPIDLLQQFPTVAARVFGPQSLPVPCPLDGVLLAAVRSKIKMRGGGLAVQLASVPAPMPTGPIHPMGFQGRLSFRYRPSYLEARGDYTANAY